MFVRSIAPVYSPPDADLGAGDKAASDAAAIAGAAAAAEADKGGDKKASSALDLAEEGKDKQIVAPADWPEDWKTRVAGEDKDYAKWLERVKSPVDGLKIAYDAQKKIRSGKANVDEPMPDPAKDAVGAKAWRKEHGIPDDPTGYELPKAVTERLTDDDKPVLATFLESFHKKNLPPSAVASVVESYLDQQEQAFAARTAADAKQAEETQDALRTELGKEFRPAVTIAKRFAEEITPGVNWFEARLDDGRKLGNIKEFVAALIDLGTQKYGDVAFAGGESSAKTMSRLEEIEHIRDQDWPKYNGDLKLQQEYQGLLDAAIKSGKRQER